MHIDCECCTRLPPEYLPGLRLSPEERAENERLARRLRANAMEACPHCVYDLGGALDGDRLTRCPECAELVSRPSNALIWSLRSRDDRATRCVGKRSGFIAGSVLWLMAAFIYSGSSDRVAPSIAVGTVTLFLAFCVLIAVPNLTAIWMRARHPALSNPVLSALAIGNTIAQLLVLALMGFMLDFVVRTF